MSQVTIGGDRLGGGKKMKAHLHNYERSTHDIGYLWRSTMAAGTLVPFMSEVALPGDTFDINLDCNILTHPTIGPLFGTYKVNLDVFQVPIRLYQPQLHMNMLDIGRDMSKVKLPQITITGRKLDTTRGLDNQQINPSCILSYLGIRGAGFHKTDPTTLDCNRNFNAIPYLAYWDIYKNYYANKQEEQGAVIHQGVAAETGTTLTTCDILSGNPTPFNIPILTSNVAPTTWATIQFTNMGVSMQITGTFDQDRWDPAKLTVWIQTMSPDTGLPIATQTTAATLFENWVINEPTGLIIGSKPTFAHTNPLSIGGVYYNQIPNEEYDTEPKITFFPLKNIDDMRQNLLAGVGTNNYTTPFYINDSTPAPYGLPLTLGSTATISQMFSQEGLGLKTYSSDLFNNWLQTEWIDGPDGISQLTAIDTSAGNFTIDELNLKNKIYNMLNRIAISGGTYDDWLDAVYTHDRQRSAENPMFIGGLAKNIVFQEVISNTATEDQPLGTLAGRGKLGSKHKGGHIIAKIDEPSYIIGIISITPNIDYSQGNKWDMNLKTMNDFHKPALDQIGFQDLITDQMAWWDTKNDVSVSPSIQIFKSAGKQPAWMNYMTNVNQVRGNFADPLQQMFMTLNRRYEPTFSAANGLEIEDITTYIDPAKFNHIFADTQRDAQNFWAQIALDITARRKMSAKVIPNL